MLRRALYLKVCEIIYQKKKSEFPGNMQEKFQKSWEKVGLQIGKNEDGVFYWSNPSQLDDTASKPPTPENKVTQNKQSSSEPRPRTKPFTTPELDDGLTSVLTQVERVREVRRELFAS